MIRSVLFSAFVCAILSGCTTAKLDPNFASAGGFSNLFGSNAGALARMSVDTTDSARTFTEQGIVPALLRTTDTPAKCSDMRI